MNTLISPDSEKVLEAISILNGGASIIPEDLDAAVSHMISKLGKEHVSNVIGMSPALKRAYLLGCAAGKSLNNGV